MEEIRKWLKYSVEWKFEIKNEGDAHFEIYSVQTYTVTQGGWMVDSYIKSRFCLGLFAYIHTYLDY